MKYRIKETKHQSGASSFQVQAFISSSWSDYPSRIDARFYTTIERARKELEILTGRGKSETKYHY